MSSLRRKCKNFKKVKANPYAGRGLEKFALVSAELEAKREKLAAELDTPLSMVKFAIGCHNKWIPIVLSKSAKKESHGSKKKSGAFVNEDKLALGSRGRKVTLCKAGRNHVGSLTKEEKPLVSGVASEGRDHGRQHIKDVAQTRLSSSTTDTAQMGGSADRQTTHFEFSSPANTGQVGGLIGEGTFLSDGLHRDGVFRTDSAFNEVRPRPDPLLQKQLSSLGDLLSIERDASGKIIEIFSASSEAQDIASSEEKEARLQGRNLKNFIGAIVGVPWVASLLASNVVFLRWHYKFMASTGKLLLPDGESLRNHEEFHTAAVSESLSPPPSDEALATSHLAPLPSPPAPLRIASESIITEQAEIVETIEDGNTTPPLQTANKQYRKCKVKGFLKMHSAPSTPRDSRQPKKPFTAGTISNVLGVSDEASKQTEVKEQLVVPKAAHPLNVPVKSRLSNVSASDAWQEHTRGAGHALAAAGLVLGLSGLAMGYISAIIGVVCWWYMLPSLRKALGDKPVVRSHHHSHVSSNNPRLTKKQAKDKVITKEVGIGKRDLQFQEHKKKVIMEGLLDRGRRSNA